MEVNLSQKYLLNIWNFMDNDDHKKKKNALSTDADKTTQNNNQNVSDGMSVVIGVEGNNTSAGFQRAIEAFATANAANNDLKLKNAADENVKPSQRQKEQKASEKNVEAGEISQSTSDEKNDSKWSVLSDNLSSADYSVLSTPGNDRQRVYRLSQSQSSFHKID